jgi:hypothetical protein
LWHELIPLLTETPISERDQHLDQLLLRYKREEITLILDKFQHMTAGRELIGEDSMLYRTYRRTFARFGGDRPFLDKQVYEKLIYEHGKLAAQRSLEPSFRHRGRSEQEMYDLLLVGVEFWEDITPPAVPPQPANFATPAQADHAPPLRELLTWGWNTDEEYVTRNVRQIAKQQPASSDVVRMVLDEGLLSGWPAKDASWAPYHALHLLGHLQAHKYARRLLALMDRENDWLSDRLPVVWGLMGSQAAPPLWTYLENRTHDPDKRAIVLNGLAAIAQAQPQSWPDIVTALINWLQKAPAADATVNGYLVFILNRMKAIEAREAIATAFEQDRVDTRIMQWHDVTMFQDRIDPTRYDE